MTTAGQIGQLGRRTANRCPVCSAPLGACVGHGPALAMPAVNIGDKPYVERIATMTDSESTPSRASESGAGTIGVVGVKSEADVAATAKPKGPLAVGVRQPVREGVVHGYRGEAEGLVTVVDAENRAAHKAALQEGQGLDTAKAPSGAEPDYLADERPTEADIKAAGGKLGRNLGEAPAATGAAAPELSGKALDAKAAELGIDTSKGGSNKGGAMSADEKRAAIAAASAPPAPEPEPEPAPPA